MRSLVCDLINLYVIVIILRIGSHSSRRQRQKDRQAHRREGHDSCAKFTFHF